MFRPWRGRQPIMMVLVVLLTGIVIVGMTTVTDGASTQKSVIALLPGESSVSLSSQLVSSIAKRVTPAVVNIASLC